jgi:PAS domain-containing protein
MPRGKQQDKEEKDRSLLYKELRARAERQISQKLEILRKQPAMTNERLIQELEVHQVELQMQNEELRSTQSELEISRARYFDLFDSAPIGYFIINEKGLVQDVNLTGASMLGMQRQKMVNTLSHCLKY